MRAPRFWYPEDGAPGWRAAALAPLAAVYAGATRARVARAPLHRAGVPVICVGNLDVGGTGKTPTVIAIAERLARRGVRPVILSRGYRGRLSGPVKVEPERHSAAEVGDEPLLLAAFADVWVARDRSAGARAAEAAGAGAILLDDGFQDPALAKDLSIVVADAAAGFGNGRVMPAGPLREPVAAGLARATALLTIGGAAAQEVFTQRWAAAVPVPRVTARIEPLATGLSLRDLPVIAFAGIGRPEKFFATLRGLGARVLRTEALGDHQPLTPTLMRRLETEAQRQGAQMVTTEKDAVRLPASFRQKVLTVPVRLVFDAPDMVDALLAKALDRPPPPPPLPRS